MTMIQYELGPPAWAPTGEMTSFFNVRHHRPLLDGLIKKIIRNWLIGVGVELIDEPRGPAQPGLAIRRYYSFDEMPCAGSGHEVSVRISWWDGRKGFSIMIGEIELQDAADTFGWRGIGVMLMAKLGFAWGYCLNLDQGTVSVVSNDYYQKLKAEEYRREWNEANRDANAGTVWPMEIYGSDYEQAQCFSQAAAVIADQEEQAARAIADQENAMAINRKYGIDRRSWFGWLARWPKLFWRTYRFFREAQ